MAPDNIKVRLSAFLYYKRNGAIKINGNPTEIMLKNVGMEYDNGGRKEI